MALFKKSKSKTEEAPLKIEPPELKDNSELEELKIRTHLAAARMKPHYIGNVTSAIYYLCDIDTEKAQESLLALNGYIRQSVEAIGRTEFLPFPWELDHAQNYIALEMLRFENKLNVTYAIEADDFDLPPLTLQPLVENAVKHGVAPLEGSGNVNISVRRLADRSIRIEVYDDGVGFDVSILNSAEKKGLSIDCLKKRIAKELNGELLIESTPGSGTRAIITFIPTIKSE